MENKIGWKVIKRLLLLALVLLCVNLGASSDQSRDGQSVLAEQMER